MYRPCSAPLFATLALSTLASAASAHPNHRRIVQCADVHITTASDDRSWSIASPEYTLAYHATGGGITLSGLYSRFDGQPVLMARGDGMPIFRVRFRHGPGQVPAATLWRQAVPSNDTADPGSAVGPIRVRRGDAIGFAVGPHGDYRGDQMQWITSVQYRNGQTFSSQGASLNQGPIWRYCVWMPTSSRLIPLDSVEYQANARERVRIAAQASGLRSPGDVPHVGATMMHPGAGMDAVRLWTAPRDGVVTVHGIARHLRGYHVVDIAVLLIKSRPRARKPSQSVWKVTGSQALLVSAGGRPAAELRIFLDHYPVKAVFHTLAFPHTAVVRTWLTLINGSPMMTPVRLVRPFQSALAIGQARWRQYWLHGGTNGAGQGDLASKGLSRATSWTIQSEMGREYWPWLAAIREGHHPDGLFMALDYIGSWRFALQPSRLGGPILRSEVTDPGPLNLLPHIQFNLPVTTFGLFHQSLDDMSRRLYDWQYQYLWGYSQADKVDRMEWDTAWYNDARNLQENFTGRLGQLDMDFPDMMRTVGMETLWDDAGWSENPDIWSPSREGPDFSLTQRYLRKMGMNWALWFCHLPTPGLMASKVGAWGDFQWRTDGLPAFNLRTDAMFRAWITAFRLRFPGSSFQTCNGGGSFGHTFSTQEYADVNMFSDPGEGAQTNTWLSYLETPDKWMDLMPSFKTGGRYDPDTGRQLLTMTPCWDLYASVADQEQLRQIAEIYHYLLATGVAGRWSYALRPKVKGDNESDVFERINYGATRACIILKNRPSGAVTIRPAGLVPGMRYRVGFASTRKTTIRTGRSLMQSGIVLLHTPPGELIYLNLPNRPGSGLDHTRPSAPGRAYCRQETNIGHSGVGIYWSAGTDNNWVSRYEVSRNHVVIGSVSTGLYFFDHSATARARADYAVRTVDGDGNRSDWVTALRLDGEPVQACALGGFFSRQGRSGWSAATQSANGEFTKMSWIAPAASPAGDANGTPNQPGGAEGYWQGSGGARVGRGWQRAGDADACCRGWTASRGGRVSVVGRVMKEYYRRNTGDTLRVRISLNERQVWPATGWARIRNNDLQGVTHRLELKVVAGDTIWFTLDHSQNPHGCVIAWMPRIVYRRRAAIDGRPRAIRVWCGSRRSVIDSSGNRWSADRWFRGGHRLARQPAARFAMPSLPATPALYERGRSGSDFRYSIPVGDGIYSVRLLFAEPRLRWSFQRPFDVSINGEQRLRNFDICQAAHGRHIAVSRVFRYVVPNRNGRIDIGFHTGWDPLQVSHEATVQGIEILPEFRPAVLLDAGATKPYVDWDGDIWRPAQAPPGAHTIRTVRAVTQASPTLYDQGLYQTGIAGRLLTFRVPLPAGLYTVHLKFAELWNHTPGRRPMDIRINNETIWRHWDPGSAAGQTGMACDLRTTGVEPDAQGNIVIQVKADSRCSAVLQALEIR
ncbi:MAG: hypothetical protein KGJ62_06980 [Armatimonadetes bacterium]|nr:hypothetical protein [Armatimonadota bacterium]MDE2207387.1 hypothetical protein [Armatimonadota bacterium]